MQLSRLFVCFREKVQLLRALVHDQAWASPDNCIVYSHRLLTIRGDQPAEQVALQELLLGLKLDIPIVLDCI